MMSVHRGVLEQVIAGCNEAIAVVQLDHNDWPVVLSNEAFTNLNKADAKDVPFADLVESLTTREQAVEISEALRARQETSFPLTIRNTDYMLVLKPLTIPGEDAPKFYVAYFRGNRQGSAAVQDTQHALLRAKRRIHDLTRDDGVTGLLNETAFRDVLDHDWAVACREKSTLAIVVFTLDDFDAYIEVFGKHASDSCLRRVGQAIRRCLRRASDVVARFEDAKFVCLSHASEEQAVRAFAESITTTVRELGLHHPRSSKGRFVTVTQDVAVTEVGFCPQTAAEFLNELLLTD